MRITQQPVSLEKPVGEEDDAALGGLRRGRLLRLAVRDRLRSAAPRERRVRARIACRVREREVIEMRYGIVGGRARTLEEVGRAFNITRERVRQIENRTLKKLQTLPEAQRLREASELSAGVAARALRGRARGTGARVPKPTRSPWRGSRAVKRGRAVNALALPSQVRILSPPSLLLTCR